MCALVSSTKQKACQQKAHEISLENQRAQLAVTGKDPTRPNASPQSRHGVVTTLAATPLPPLPAMAHRVQPAPP
jgi:hypothetical protein